MNIKKIFTYFGITIIILVGGFLVAAQIAMKDLSKFLVPRFCSKDYHTTWTS